MSGGAPRGAVLLLAAAVCLASASPAAAQRPWDTPSSGGFEQVPQTGAALDFGFWTHRVPGSQLAALSGLLRAGLVVDQSLEIGVDVGFVWADVGAYEGIITVNGNHGAATNPYFSLMGILGEQRWRLRLGGGIAIPAALSSNEVREALFFGSAIRGMSELWLWAPDRLGVVLAAELQLVPVDGLYLEFGARAGTLITAASSGAALQESNPSGTYALDLTLDLHAAIGYRWDEVLAGVRVREVINPTFAMEIQQTSVELFGRLTLPIDESSIELFGEVRGLANLGGGYGVEGLLPIWGAHLALGIASTPLEVPDGRFGITDVHFDGVEAVDEESIAACLGTRARARVRFDIGLRGTPECGEAPFDGSHLPIALFSWPWTAWHLFDENVFERDVDRIERWYRARGYYDARVTSTQVVPPVATEVDHAADECGDGEGNCTAEVSFGVEEGEPVRVARIAIHGLEGLPPEIRGLLRATLRLHRDDRFDEALYEDTKQAMLRELANASYGRANVRAMVKVNQGRREAYIVFLVDAGSPNVIGRICVAGHGDLPPGPMIAAAGFDPVDRFSLDGLNDAQRALYALGAFSAVEVGPASAGAEDPSEEDAGEDEASADEASADEASADEARQPRDENPIPEDAFCTDAPASPPEGTELVDILIRVTPGRRYRAGVGVGFQAGQSVTVGNVSSFSNQQNAAQWDLHVSAVAEDRNFAESMIRARFELRPRLIFEMPFLASWTPAEPLPFGALASGSLLWPSFLEARTNLRIQNRADLGPMPYTNFFRLEVDALIGPERTFLDGRVYVGIFLHGNYFLPTDRQPAEPRDQLQQTLASWLEEAIRLDFRDDPRNPRSGVYLALSSQQSALPAPVSTWQFVRWNIDGRGYVPLPGGITVAARFQIGAMHVLSYDTDSLDEDNVYALHQLGPPSLHFRGGGASSNRGFLPGLLGDASQVYVTQARSEADIRQGRPIEQRPTRISGGTSMWQASLELRIPITVDLGVVAFADAGDVIRPATGGGLDGFRMDRPQFSFGLGLRYRTIIGPIRLDIALRPNELQDLGQTSSLPTSCANDGASGCRPSNTLFGVDVLPGAFHLTIGESF